MTHSHEAATFFHLYRHRKQVLRYDYEMGKVCCVFWWLHVACFNDEQQGTRIKRQKNEGLAFTHGPHLSFSTSELPEYLGFLLHRRILAQFPFRYLCSGVSLHKTLLSVPDRRLLHLIQKLKHLGFLALLC